MRSMITKAFFAVLAIGLVLCGTEVVNADDGTNTPNPGVTYYVSPHGDDNSAGTSSATPWRSLDKVAAGLFNPGDAVLFEGGATFTGCLQVTREMATGSDALPVIFGAYGNGKFHIQANCAGKSKAAIDIVGTSAIVVQDCILTGDRGKTPYGVWIRNPFDVVAKNITVRRCDISGFFTPNPKDYGAEIFVTGHPGAGLDGVNVIDNVLHGAEGPASPDDNGLYGYGRDKNIDNVLYEGNIVYDIGGKPGGLNGAVGNGIIADGVSGGIIQHNVAYNLGGNVDTCGGPAAIWAYSATKIVIQYNEVYDVKPISFRQGCDWSAFNLDGHVTDSVIQYNYAHDNWGAGLGVFVDGEWERNTIRYNVAINNATSTGATYFGNIVIANAQKAPGLNIYNNTLISEGPPNTTAGVSIQGTAAGALIANNLIVALNGANYFSTGADLPDVRIFSNGFAPATNFAIRWKDKDYTDLASWRQASGAETLDGTSTAFVEPPELDLAAIAQVCGGYKSLCPKVAFGFSPKLIGAGMDLTKPPFNLDVGARDFAGYAIPSSGIGTGFGIGAVSRSPSRDAKE